MKEKPVIAPFKLDDYRVMRPMMFLEKNGNRVACIQQLSTFTIGECKLSFITPNSASLFYNKSCKEYEAAGKIYNEIIRPHLIQNSTVDIKPEELPKLYDYFEHIQASIVTIYSAIEALSNLAIPADFTLKKRNNKGITEIWDKSAIERWAYIEDKVGNIVPGILKIESPKTLPLWENFKKLKEVRDDIIHQKQSINKPQEVEAGFLGTLLHESIFIKILAGFELIQYFCQKDETHVYFPILTSETPVYINMVNRFDGMFHFIHQDENPNIN